MKGSRSVWKWGIVALLILVLLPLFLVMGGVLFVTPLRRQTGPVEGGEHAIVVVERAADPTVQTELAGTASGTGGPAAPLGLLSTPTPTPGDATALLSLNPWNPVTLVFLPLLAGFVVFGGAVVLVGIERRWQDSAPRADEAELNGEPEGRQPRMERLRVALLAFGFWLALSIFLLLDLAFAVSVYLQFVVIYAAFWILVGALLLIGRPLREKLLILGLFLVLVVSIYFVDWNSRKPFLKDFHRIEAGMTEQQVDQIMAGYMKSYGGGPPASLREYEPEYDGQGRLLTGWITYRHTKEGWGDSDWGEITFADGQVVEKRFLPD
jgi:hypothetical protein